MYKNVCLYFSCSLPFYVFCKIIWKLREYKSTDHNNVILMCTACGVCHSDLHIIKKDQPFPMPVVLGHEVTGEVVEHGPLTDAATVKR